MADVLANDASTILRELSLTEAPRTVANVETALRFFRQRMPALSRKDQISFLKGMDLHDRVEETLLIPPAHVAAFRKSTENPLRLFYTKAGVALGTLGIREAGRSFVRFDVVAPTHVLASRCVSVRLTWTDDPRYVGVGGGIQYIIPDAERCLVVSSSP